MSARSILTVLVACIVLSTGIGFAFGAASQPDSATAAKGSKSLKQIKRDIQALSNEVDANFEALNSEVDQVQSGIGTTGTITSVTDRLIRLESDTRRICIELGTFC